MTVPLRVLPIHVEPVHGETVEGFTSRLAHTHLIEEADIRRVVFEQLDRRSYTASDPRFIHVLERLAELSPGTLGPDFDRHGMWVRCGHSSWRPQKCHRCRRFADPRSACIVCSSGTGTMTIARGGPVCLPHGRWAFRGQHAELAGVNGYEQAELVVRSQLWQRGVALHTGELNLAAGFVRAWHAGSGAPTVIDERMECFNVQALNSYQEALLCAYPEVIDVAGLLTAPRTITPLLNVAVSALTHTDLLMRGIAKVIGGEPNDSLRAFTLNVVGHAHRAMLYMYGLRSSHHVKHQLCPLNRGLIVASHRQRACLLRHANPRSLPDIGSKSGASAPRARVVRNWKFEIDELALK